MIRIQDLYIQSASGKSILNNIHLDLYPNEIVGLVGGSGSGKSTIFMAIFQELLPQKSWKVKGTISVDLQKVQPVFQDAYSSFNPNWTMLECLLEPIQIRNMVIRSGKEKIYQILPWINMQESDLVKKPGEFSGGQLQRFAILRSLLTNPEYLLMDEPVSGLDPIVRKNVLELILKVQKELKLGILFITHDLDVLRDIADRVYVLSHGEIIDQGVMSDFPNATSHPYTKELFDPWNELA
jgi:ABC-type dipeptide/oligopeptide/nickel transport system ATPase subunit